MAALGAQEHGGRRRALLPRLRRLPAPRSGERRSHHPARRVPDQLHALPARNRAGHAADDVRVPDAGRAPVRLRGRQCLDVRRLDRDVGSDPDGAPDHAPEQDGHLVGRAPALCRASRRPWRSSPAMRWRPRMPELDAETGHRAADRRGSTRETSAVVVQYPDILGRITDLDANRRGGAGRRRAADRGGDRAGRARPDQVAGRNGRRHRRRRRPVRSASGSSSAGPMSGCSPAARSMSGKCRAASPAKRSMPRASAASC